MKKSSIVCLKIIFSCLIAFLFVLSSCEKDEAVDSQQNKEYRCGTSLPSGYQCISAAGESVPTTYEIPELYGSWESSADFCIEYKSDGTGIITFKPTTFTSGKTQRIKWGAMVRSNGEFELSGAGSIYICHESLEGSLDPQIIMLSFKRSTKQWLGWDLEKVSSCGSVGSGNNNNTTGNGNIAFWTSSDLKCGPITVSIAGKTGVINKYYYDSTPPCGASGAANFELPAGDYTFTASCTSYHWPASQVTIRPGVCLRMRLH